MKNERGMTMIEVMIGAAVAGLAIAAAYRLLWSATTEVGAMSVSTVLDVEGRTLLDEIVRDLQTARSDSLALFNETPPASGNFRTASFVPVDGVRLSAGAITLESPFTITWTRTIAPGEVANGKDDTREGWIDEQRITRTSTKDNVAAARTGRATATSGLLFRQATVNGRITVTVTVELQGIDGRGRLMTRSLTSEVALRN